MLVAPETVKEEEKRKKMKKSKKQDLYGCSIN
jgi:hypothetical protein